MEGLMRADPTPLAVTTLTPVSEFHWDSVGPSANHAHVAKPVVVHLDKFGARSVLDLGCGNGWFTAALARCGFDAMGVDLSESGVRLATLAHPEVAFRRLDVTQPAEPDLCGQFDAVVAIELLDHVATPRNAIAHALQLLRPGGLLIASAPFHGYVKNVGLALSSRFDERWHALRDSGRVKFYSRQTFLTLLADCGLQDLHFETIGRVPLIARSMLVVGTKPMGPAQHGARGTGAKPPADKGS